MLVNKRGKKAVARSLEIFNVAFHTLAHKAAFAPRVNAAVLAEGQKHPAFLVAVVFKSGANGVYPLVLSAAGKTLSGKGEKLILVGRDYIRRRLDRASQSLSVAVHYAERARSFCDRHELTYIFRRNSRWDAAGYYDASLIRRIKLGFVHPRKFAQLFLAYKHTRLVYLGLHAVFVDYGCISAKR